MKILYYSWKENTGSDMIAALQLMDYQVVATYIPCQDYEYDIAFMERLKTAILQYQCDIVFSFDYFPVIAKVTKQLQMNYLSWIYDSPHWTLYSPTVWNCSNYIFTFDYQQYLMLRNKGVNHAYHLPLAVNTERLNRQLGLPEREIADEMELGFVGSLYENNLFDQIVYLPDDLRGYLDGLMDIQKMVFGSDLLNDLIAGPVAQKLENYVKLEMAESYGAEKSVLYADMLYQKITATERIEYLNLLSNRNRLCLYTASDAALVPKADYAGIVSYEKEMPEVFCKSKINLNFTLRSIMSGIPLRALDIMGAGGFLVTNYQPELAEYFVNGEELVMYESKGELVELVQYYLEHEKKRREIAHQGWEKIQVQFSYQKQVEAMFLIWEKERRAE